MMDRLLSLVVAVSLALLVWLYARSRDQESLDNVNLPVEITLAPNQTDLYTLEVSGPSQVVASFTGPPARIRDLQSALQRQEVRVTLTLTVPEERLGESRYSDTLLIDSADIHVPVGVTALVVEGRNRIPVTLHRMVERRLPVRLESDEEGSVGAAEIDPPLVLVRGPQEVLDRTRTVPTQPFHLPGRSAATSGSTSTRVALVQEMEGRPIQVTPARVVVRPLAQARKTFDLIDVPVQFLCPPNFGLRPTFRDERDGRVSLKLEGPIQDEVPRVLAFVDLTRGQYSKQGLYSEPLQLQLPRDFQLVQGPPRPVPFQLQSGDFSAPGLGSRVRPTE